MVDILVLGATGYCGRLVTKYLHSHPQRSSFTFGIAARSQKKLDNLVSELSLHESIKIFLVDVTEEKQIDQAVAESKVVLNTVGPFWLWGTPVVRSCIRHGKHYVDLSGELPWVKDIIFLYDFTATRSHSIIVPACGIDSVPSDVLPFIANQTIKSLLGPQSTIDTSVSAWKFLSSPSGGTVASALAVFEEVPQHKLTSARKDFFLSPVQGVPQPGPRLVYSLPFSSPPVQGAFFIMSPMNRAVVQRTWGLLEAASLSKKSSTRSSYTDAQIAQLTYGPNFKYDEFMVTSKFISAVACSIMVIVGFLLMRFSTVRWLVKWIMPQPGEGPPVTIIEKGFVEVVNTTTTSPDENGRQVNIRSTLYGKGEPGYQLASVIVAEAALGLLLDAKNLPFFAREGGVLTPMTALGDVLVERLRKTELFKIESQVMLESTEDMQKKD